MLKKLINKSITVFGYKILKLDTLNINDAINYNTKEIANEFYKSSDSVNTYLDKQRIKAYEEIYSYISTPNLSNCKILDAGCGPGYFTNLVYRISKNILGVDFSSSAIDIAKSNYPHIKFLVSDLSDDFEEKFDLIFCISVLEHLEHPEKILNNLIHQLKTNGKIIITIPDGRLDNFTGHIHFWSAESWNLFLKKSTENMNWKVHHLKAKADLLTILSF